MTVKTRSAKVAGGLCLLMLIVVFSAGCTTNTDIQQFHAPEVGSLIDRDSVITIEEKWRVYEGDCSRNYIAYFPFDRWNCGYSYHAKLTNGQEYLVNSSLYDSLPLYQTGLASGPSNGFRSIILISEFYPVNVTSYSDVKNQVKVIP